MHEPDFTNWVSDLITTIAILAGLGIIAELCGVYFFEV